MSILTDIKLSHSKLFNVIDLVMDDTTFIRLHIPLAAERNQICDALHRCMGDYFQQQICEHHRRNVWFSCPLCNTDQLDDSCQELTREVARLRREKAALEVDVEHLAASLNRANKVRGSV